MHSFHLKLILKNEIKRLFLEQLKFSKFLSDKTVSFEDFKRSEIALSLIFIVLDFKWDNVPNISGKFVVFLK